MKLNKYMLWGIGLSLLDFVYCTWSSIHSISISCFLNSLRKLYCFDAKFRDHSINNRLIRSNHESTNHVFSNFFTNISHNLFVTSKNKTTNSQIHEFKVLQNVFYFIFFKMKRKGLKCFVKYIVSKKLCTKEF